MTVALQGDQGKPRPALVVQADSFAELSSITVLPITGTLVEAPLLRVPLEPTNRMVSPSPRRSWWTSRKRPRAANSGRSSGASTMQPW